MKRCIFICLAVWFFLTCPFPATTHCATVEIGIYDNLFRPSDITINQGDTVVWTNRGRSQHEILFGENCQSVQQSIPVTPGGSYQQTFPEPGVYSYFCPQHCREGMTGVIRVVGPSIFLPLPQGQEIFTYPPIITPTRHQTPSLSRPIGVGPVAEGGCPVSIQIEIGPFAGMVDMYLGILAPSIDPTNIYLVHQDNSVHTVAQGGIAPWRSHISGVLRESPFGDLPADLFPPGQVELLLVVTPSDVLLDRYFFWNTSFRID